MGVADIRVSRGVGQIEKKVSPMQTGKAWMSEVAGISRCKWK